VELPNKARYSHERLTDAWGDVAEKAGAGAASTASEIPRSPASQASALELDLPRKLVAGERTALMTQWRLIARADICSALARAMAWAETA
jgi:hypothetical protein